MSFLDEILNSDDDEEEEIEEDSEEEDKDLEEWDGEEECDEDEYLDAEEDVEDLEEEPLTESNDSATTKHDNTSQIIEDVKVEEEDDTTSDIIDKVLDKIEEGNSDRTKNGTSQVTQSVGTHGNGYSHNNVGHTPTANKQRHRKPAWLYSAT